MPVRFTFKSAACFALIGWLAGLSLAPLTSLAEDTAESARKGEQIKFSGGGKDSTTLKPNAPDQSSEGGIFDYLRKPNGGAGEVEVPISRPQNSRANSRQLQDLIDKEKNWIFLTPQNVSGDNFGKDRKPEEMFNLRDEFDGNPKKSSKTLEDFWTQEERKPGSKSNKPGSSNAGENHEQLLFGNASVADPRNSAPKTESANWNSLFVQKDKTDPTATSRELYGSPLNPNGNLPSALNSSGTSLSEFSTKTKPAADEFLKLLKSPSMKLLANSPADPINSAADASDQDINPVVGRRLSDAAKGVKPLDSAALSKGNTFPLATFSPGTLGDLNARLAEQANQRPAFAPSPESKPAAARPAVLELPRRKF